MVLNGTAPKNSVAYFKEFTTKFSRTVKRLEEAQAEENDSAEEGKGQLQYYSSVDIEKLASEINGIDIKEDPFFEMNPHLLKNEKFMKEFDAEMKKQFKEKRF